MWIDVSETFDQRPEMIGIIYELPLEIVKNMQQPYGQLGRLDHGSCSG
jgi:hypothetical protein